MGSTGTGKFGDYQPGSATRCDQAIDSDLEDVATSEHYVSYRLHPARRYDRAATEDAYERSSSSLRTRNGNRSGQSSDSVPDYLLLCLRKGYQYEGTVSASSVRPVHQIDVHLDPI